MLSKCECDNIIKWRVTTDKCEKIVYNNLRKIINNFN